MYLNLWSLISSTCGYDYSFTSTLSDGLFNVPLSPGNLEFLALTPHLSEPQVRCIPIRLGYLRQKPPKQPFSICPLRLAVVSLRVCVSLRRCPIRFLITISRLGLSVLARHVSGCRLPVFG